MMNLVKLRTGRYRIDKPNRFRQRVQSKILFPIDPINHLFNTYIDINTKFKNQEISPISGIASEDPVVQQMMNDISSHLHISRQISLWKEVEDIISKENFLISDQEKQSCILKAMATYATSHQYYGPVVTEWAASLLDTALLEKRKLIFLARDGIAPYRAACLLKSAQSPKYDSVQLSLIYVSRTLTYSSTLLDDKISSSDELVKEYVKKMRKRDPNILQKYILQECGLKHKDRCLFVDVGFTGSLIEPLLTQLDSLAISARFNFLISHTSNKKVKNTKHDAKGFLAHHIKRPLEVVSKSGGNPAVHWIEDTHQSIIMSPKVLITRADGKIVPAIVVKDGREIKARELFGEQMQTCRQNPEDYLVKTFGLKGVLDAVSKAAYFVERSVEPMISWKEASEERRKVFGDFLTSLQKNERSLLIKH